MRKLQLLQDWIETVLPEFKREPERLAIFADEGRIACTAAGASLSFERGYKVQLQLWDFAGDVDAVTAALLFWLARYQPELLQSYRTNPEAIQFRAEKLDGRKVDLEMEFQLTERVKVERRADGKGLDVSILPEPFEETGDRQWSLYVGPDLVAEWVGPDHLSFA